MKFATFIAGGREQVGMFDPDASRIYPIDIAGMVELITGFDAIDPGAIPASPSIDLASVKLLAPIPRPQTTANMRGSLRAAATRPVQ